jgi:hypothetical protein
MQATSKPPLKLLWKAGVNPDRGATINSDVVHECRRARGCSRVERGRRASGLGWWERNGGECLFARQTIFVALSQGLGTNRNLSENF